eukprot:CAMPEP_0180351112 /NCGR_PEP_ID=MMETSP0989-20121125/6348_1 /TAXON_ID=697907 /ORGANISM="non described non described, Strain CCMP2293" /LENGTH=1100 /DNA_ID=CAMNT_0022340519 /DNA_START=84 /DNA_END=3386 /DNA_ORIENTATION=+
MGDHPTFDAEDLAQKRLELEALAEKRYVMAADLEKRRRATLLAQKRQVEIKNQLEREERQAEAGGKLVEEEEEDPDELNVPPKGERNPLNENMEQRLKARELDRKKNELRLRELNKDRWNLQDQQAKLAEERKEKAHSMEMEMVKLQEEQKQSEEAMAMTGRTSKAIQKMIGAKLADPWAIFPVPKVEVRGNEIGLGGEDVEMKVAALDTTVHTLGETIPRQQGYLQTIRGQRAETEKTRLIPAKEVPARNPNLKADDVIDQKHIDLHIIRMVDGAEEINKRLQDEAQQKAERMALKTMLFETTDMMIADICAEAVFSRFWAERTAATFIIQALLKDGRREKQSESDKNVFRAILREFQQKRVHQTFMHIHSMPVFDGSIMMEQAVAPKKKAWFSGKDKGGASEEYYDMDLDATVLNVYTDVPEAHITKQMTGNEKHFWGKVQPFPVFFSSGSNIGVQAPNPGGTMLALAAVGDKMISIYDVRHLPPLLVRRSTAPGIVVSLAWSRDSTQLCALDRSGAISMWSLRLDVEPQALVSKDGVFKMPALVLTHEFPPLVNPNDGHVSDEGLHDLIDTSRPWLLRPSCLVFHPCQTITGQQPSVMVGTVGGAWFKFNTKVVTKAVFAPCVGVNNGGVEEAVDPAHPTVPKRELFVRHLAKMLLVQPFADASRQVTVDDAGYIGIWPYNKKSFSTLGWFSPETFYQVVVSDVVYEDDPALPGELLFPPREIVQNGNGPGSMMWAAALLAHRQALPDLGVGGTPIQRRPWASGTVIRKKGTIEVFRGEDIGEGEQVVFHELKLDSHGNLMSHTRMTRKKRVLLGDIVKAKVDHNGLVILGALPSSQHTQARLMVFRFDLETRTLQGPRIDLALPPKFKPAAVSQAKAGDTINTNPLFPGIDFDVGPAQRGDNTQAVFILMQNQISVFSLDTGRELMKPIIPLDTQRRRCTLDQLRVVGIFAEDVLLSSDLFKPPTPKGRESTPLLPGMVGEEEEPPGPRHVRCEGLALVLTSQGAPTVFMYSLGHADNNFSLVAGERDTGLPAGVKPFTPIDRRFDSPSTQTSSERGDGSVPSTASSQPSERMEIEHQDGGRSAHSPAANRASPTR